MSTSQSYGEKELLLRVAEGDEYAFRELMSVYQPLLLSFVFQLTKSTASAEEIVQDVFLKIWMGRESLAHVQRFKSYLFIVCRNYCLDQLRKMVRERKMISRWEKEQAGLQDTPSSEAEVSEAIHTLLDDAVQQLPPQQQKVYVLSRRYRLSYAQIATKTGLSVLTVKKYMKLAIASVVAYTRARQGKIYGYWISLILAVENFI